MLSRHRLVVAVAAGLSALLLVAVVIVSPPTYRASAAVVLLNPPAVPVASVNGPPVPPKVQNPYVQFGDLSVVVDILVRVINSDEVVASLKARGLDGQFEIAANRDFYRGPIVDVAAESSTEEGALRDTRLVVKEVQDQLETLQTSQGTDPDYFIKTGTVVGADRATKVFSGTLRLLIAVGGFGALLTVGSGLLADFVSRRRSSRRGGPHPSSLPPQEPDLLPGPDPFPGEERTPMAPGTVASAPTDSWQERRSPTGASQETRGITSRNALEIVFHQLDNSAAPAPDGPSSP